MEREAEGVEEGNGERDDEEEAGAAGRSVRVSGGSRRAQSSASSRAAPFEVRASVGDGFG